MGGQQTVALAEPNELMLLKSVSFVTILTAFRALYANPPLSDTSPDSSGSLSHSGAGRSNTAFAEDTTNSHVLPVGRYWNTFGPPLAKNVVLMAQSL